MAKTRSGAGQSQSQAQPSKDQSKPALSSKRTTPTGPNVWARLKSQPLIGQTLPILPLIVVVTMVTVAYPLCNKALLFAFSNLFVGPDGTPPQTIFQGLKGDGSLPRYFLIFSTFYTLNSVVAAISCFVCYLVGFDSETVLAFATVTLDYPRVDEMELISRSLVSMRAFLKPRLFMAGMFTYFVYSGAW